MASSIRDIAGRIQIYSSMLQLAGRHQTATAMNNVKHAAIATQTKRGEFRDVAAEPGLSRSQGKRRGNEWEAGLTEGAPECATERS